MQNLLTIPSKALEEGLVRLSKNWVTNGHWAIRKSRIKDSDSFKNAATVMQKYKKVKKVLSIEDEMIEKLLPCQSDCIGFSVSHWCCINQTHNTNILSRFLFIDDNEPKEEHFIQELYVQTLGLEIGDRLYSAGTGKPFKDEHGTFLVMPICVSDSYICKGSGL